MAATPPVTSAGSWYDPIFVAYSDITAWVVSIATWTKANEPYLASYADAILGILATFFPAAVAAKLYLALVEEWVTQIVDYIITTQGVIMSKAEALRIDPSGAMIQMVPASVALKTARGHALAQAKSVAPTEMVPRPLTGDEMKAEVIKQITASHPTVPDHVHVATLQNVLAIKRGPAWKVGG